MAASVRDVARVAGVSVGTVSNVLNHPEKVTSATVERVQNAIATLDFVPNAAARQLRSGLSRTIGMIVLDARNPFFNDVARGAEQFALQAGHIILVGNSNESVDREAAYLNHFEQQRVDGLLITPVHDHLERLWRLRELNMPVVFVDRASSDKTFSSVAVDDEYGGHLAAQHLIERGRNRIAFVGGPLGLRQVDDRLAGARRACAESSASTLEVVSTLTPTVDEGRRVGAEIAARPASKRPNAIFAANDLLALGVLQSLNAPDHALVPHDIAVIGYDDIDFAAAATVPLSSIRQPRELIGSRAVELLLDAKGDARAEPTHLMFQPELVARRSTEG